MLICKIFGHDLQEPVKIHTTDTGFVGGKWTFYMARCCSRCNARFPCSEDGIKAQERVSAIMNKDRARLGLSPLNW